MNKIILVGVIALVILIGIVVAGPFLFGHGGSCSYITPSDAASVIGGTWSLQQDTSYCYTVSNGQATVKYFNGKTTTMSLGSLGGSSFASFSQYTPTGGMTEFLNGTVNGKSASIQANYVTYSSQDVAKQFFSIQYMMAGPNAQNISSNEFVVNTGGFGGTYMYTVVKLSGNTVYVVQVTVPVQLSTSQLADLANYLG